MNQDLASALKCAKEGNKFLMDYNLNLAKEHARITNSLPEYELQASKIRNNLANTHIFHRNQMEHELNRAANYAHEGNTRLMEYCFEAAKQHAIQIHSLNEWEVRARDTRMNQLGNTTSFHKKRMQDEIQMAVRYAKEGDRRMMEYCLSQARDHAEYIHCMSEWRMREEEVVRQLGDVGGFHLRKMEEELRSARRYAETGHGRLMQYCFDQAEIHADLAGYDDFVGRMSEIAAVFHGVDLD